MADRNSSTNKSVEDDLVRLAAHRLRETAEYGLQHGLSYQSVRVADLLTIIDAVTKGRKKP